MPCGLRDTRSHARSRRSCPARPSHCARSCSASAACAPRAAAHSRCAQRSRSAQDRAALQWRMLSRSRTRCRRSDRAPRSRESHTLSLLLHSTKQLSSSCELAHLRVSTQPTFARCSCRTHSRSLCVGGCEVFSCSLAPVTVGEPRRRALGRRRAWAGAVAEVRHAVPPDVGGGTGGEDCCPEGGGVPPPPPPPPPITWLAVCSLNTESEPQAMTWPLADSVTRTLL